MNYRIVGLLVPLAVLMLAYAYRELQREAESTPTANAAAATFTDSAAADGAVPARQPIPEPSGQAAAPAAAARVSPGCEIVSEYLLTAEGTVTEVFRCVPGRNQRTGHPYEAYPTAALESLAYADWKAAEVLGMRLRVRDPERAMSLVLRAAALSGGDTTPIIAYSNAYPVPTAIDGRPVANTVRVKYVLSAVAELLGDESADLEYWENMILEHSGDPAREMQRLQERARELFEDVRRIRIEVLGAPDTGGRSDA